VSGSTPFEVGRGEAGMEKLSNVPGGGGGGGGGEGGGGPPLFLEGVQEPPTLLLPIQAWGEAGFVLDPSPMPLSGSGRARGAGKSALVNQCTNCGFSDRYRATTRASARLRRVARPAVPDGASPPPIHGRRLSGAEASLFQGQQVGGVNPLARPKTCPFHSLNPCGPPGHPLPVLPIPDTPAPAFHK